VLLNERIKVRPASKKAVDLTSIVIIEVTDIENVQASLDSEEYAQVKLTGLTNTASLDLYKRFQIVR
jgi:uncharacterized protein (DUF1330 family)